MAKKVEREVLYHTDQKFKKKIDKLVEKKGQSRSSLLLMACKKGMGLK